MGIVALLRRLLSYLWRRSSKKPDLMSELPDELLCCIMSSLSIDEAVRSSTLSKRLKPLWKHASHIDFDWTHMIEPFSQLVTKNNPNSSSSEPYFGQGYLVLEQAALQYGKRVWTILNQQYHHGGLTSCRFRHFSRNIFKRELEAWVEFVLHKNKMTLSCLSLECECSIFESRQKMNGDRPLWPLSPRFQHGIFSNLCSLELTNYVMVNTCAFESCQKMKILKLKNIITDDDTLHGILGNCSGLEKLSLIESTGFMKLKIQKPGLQFLELRWLMVNEIEIDVSVQVVVLDSLICLASALRINYALHRSLTTLHIASNPTAQRIHFRSDHSMLKTHEILQRCTPEEKYHFESQRTNIFQNLVTLSIDLDLNNVRDVLALSFILRSCINLETLEITIPGPACIYYRRLIGDQMTTASIPMEKCSDSSDDCALRFPMSLFWERPEVHDCINDKLKFTTLRGFTGKEQEVKFVKHLVTRATMMEKICVICTSSSVAEEATSLLSLARASINLSVILKSDNKNHLIEFREAVRRMSLLTSNHTEARSSIDNNRMRS